jgi:hypothetical protein
MAKCKHGNCGSKVPKESKWPKAYKEGYCFNHYRQFMQGTLRNYNKNPPVCKNKPRDGNTYTGAYLTWYAMVSRCTNPEHPQYDKYCEAAGRGVCEAWLNFEQFLLDMGERPKGLTLDRIDNSKGYYKNNCRWATPKQQANNRG